jgi:hypothetical protein
MDLVHRGLLKVQSPVDVEDLTGKTTLDFLLSRRLLLCRLEQRRLFGRSLHALLRSCPDDGPRVAIRHGLAEVWWSGIWIEETGARGEKIWRRIMLLIPFVRAFVGWEALMIRDTVQLVAYTAKQRLYRKEK